ncbi:RWD domain-containing protein 3 [Paramormyrops kingsleyae]|uniref:RWD domain-containing protein 3 n=1 Tax=Paramormyrops kingsleyae TaxID=1676925 RepID=A0A3B3T151_9TELE|nr:RWD domain-containing protein 3 [Paramormyrops kingsleyae]
MQSITGGTSMSEIALDEVSVLSAIYCERDEFALLEQSEEKGTLFQIRIMVADRSEGKSLNLLFQLPPEYPSCVPIISVNSEQLTRKQCQGIKQKLLEKASGLVSEPMVHQLLLWLQQNVDNVISLEPTPRLVSTPGNGEQCSEDGTWMALLLIDHMRSKAKYIKAIEKWTSELELTGRLFLGRLILILLQGTRRHIKEYLHLLKTTKVDVDSSGRRCKEKMMSVLCEKPLLEEHKELTAFKVKEFSSLEELRKEFDSLGLLKLYQEFVNTSL